MVWFLITFLIGIWNERMNLNILRLETNPWKQIRAPNQEIPKSHPIR